MRRVLVVTSLVVLVLTIAASCGKKAPPMVPDEPPVPGVCKFGARVVEGQVWATFSVRCHDGDVAAEYIVHRYRESTDTPRCDECPKPFEPVYRVGGAELLAPAGGNGLATFVEPYEEGYRYGYKVVAVNSTGSRRQESDLVVLE